MSYLFVLPFLHIEHQSLKLLEKLEVLLLCPNAATKGLACLIILKLFFPLTPVGENLIFSYKQARP